MSALLTMGGDYDVLVEQGIATDLGARLMRGEIPLIPGRPVDGGNTFPGLVVVKELATVC